MHVDTKSQNLNADQNLFGWEWSEMVVASLFTGI